MDNKVIRNELENFYHDRSATDNYIAVYNLKGTIYATITNGTHLFANGVKLDKASRGAGYSLRFKPNTSDKLALMIEETIVLCSTEMFNELVSESKYNKGEIAEKLVTEYFGQEWEKDNVPFTEDGDLTVNGRAYQIKFEKATFINEAQMMRMRAEA